MTCSELFGILKLEFLHFSLLIFFRRSKELLFCKKTPVLVVRRNQTGYSELFGLDVAKLANRFEWQF